MKVLSVVVLSLVLLFVADAQQVGNIPHSMFWFEGTVHDNIFSTEDFKKMNGDPTPQWFDQKLDHFDLASKKTFKQLYYVNSDYYQKGGPVLLYFNGEGPLNPGAVTGGFMMKIAKQLNALVVSFEHRFFGQSVPFSNLATENYKFLSVDQSLADSAYFTMKYTEQEDLGDAPWIAIGGSYSGMLVTAYRLRYPNLTTLAYSSSGVVHPIVDYTQYWDVVTQDWGFSKCNVLVNITETVNGLLKTSTGKQRLKDMFNLCEDLTDDNIADFWFYISGPAEGFAQYGYIDQACEVLNKAPSPIEGWTELMDLSSSAYMRKRHGIEVNPSMCVDTDWEKQLSNISIENSQSRSWSWFKLTTFGFYKNPTKAGVFSPLNDLNYHLKKYQQAYGLTDMYPDTDWLRAQFGDFYPSQDRIVSVGGLADPWNPCYSHETLVSTNPTFFIDAEDASHCKDLMGDTPNDSPQLKKTREDVLQTITSWMN